MEVCSSGALGPVRVRLRNARGEVGDATAGHFLVAREAAWQILRDVQPTHATAIVIGGSPDNVEFLGTAFALRRGQFFLTALHCVGSRESIGLLLPAQESRVFPVKVIHRHPSADLAVLDLGRDFEAVTPFWTAVDNLGLGEEFFAFGYPEDALEGRGAPVPRLFVGNFQRFFDHRDSLSGRGYPASEMSIPAPRGLSGGPVFRPGAPVVLTGMVTANFDSTTALEAHEEEDQDGRKRTLQYQRVISYGVALRLASFGDWLDDLIPPRESRS